tara:strand:- start:105 stop:326 length:222 start_codon:yes stop_codon:yes gene_type:complete
MESVIQFGRLMGQIEDFASYLKKKLVSDDPSSRWAECQSCEYLFKPTGTCKKCGCFMKLKTKLKNAKCPIGKW